MGLCVGWWWQVAPFAGLKWLMLHLLPADDIQRNGHHHPSPKTWQWNALASDGYVQHRKLQQNTWEWAVACLMQDQCPTTNNQTQTQSHKLVHAHSPSMACALRRRCQTANSFPHSLQLRIIYFFPESSAIWGAGPPACCWWQQGHPNSTEPTAYDPRFGHGPVSQRSFAGSHRFSAELEHFGTCKPLDIWSYMHTTP